MSAVGQATTPTFVYNLPQTIDLTAAHAHYFTLAQNGRKIRKEGDALAVSAHSVSVYLSQRDTVWLQPGQPFSIQLNWTYADGSRGMTREKFIDVERNLEPEVLP